MVKPTSHLFVCGAARPLEGTEAAACSCDTGAALDILNYLRQRVAEREMYGVKVTACECIDLCRYGPVVIAHPDGNWYCNVGHEEADDLLDAVHNNAILRSISGCVGCQH